jgi:hypothetical protein
MNKTEKEYNERVPEVNLVELTRRLFNRLENLFRWLGKVFLIGFVFITRRVFWILGFVILGVLVAFLHHRISEKYYAAEFTIQNNIEDISYLLAQVNDLHKYCEENNDFRLMERLNLEEDVVKRIRDIEAFWIVDLNNDEIPDFVDYQYDHNVYDTVNVRMTNNFCVVIESYDPEDFPQIRDGILNMISSNELVISENEKRLEAIRENLDVIAVQIRKLDSLENVKYFQNPYNIPPEGSQIVFLQEQHTQLFYGSVFALYTQKQENEELIDIYSEPVTLKHDLVFPAIEENSLSFFLMRWVLIITISGLVVLILWHNRRSLREIYTSNP